MIQHPLPPHILQTSLNNLPLASSQIASQITKKQLEMKKFIQENIHSCLDLFKSNQDLLIKLKETNKSSDNLKNWETDFKKIAKSTDYLESIQNAPQSDTQIDKNEDRIKVAIRHANLEDVIKLFSSLTQNQQIKIGSIIPSQFPMPNRQNRPRIVNTLKMLTSSTNLPLDVL